MGCDIHPHIELKIKGQWEHYSCPRIQRWYALFERICGVRGDLTNAISPPRGLPDDVSIVTKTIWKVEGGHTPTWLTDKELDSLIRWAERQEGQESWQHNELGYLCGNMFADRNEKFEDCRFVCWFDN